MFDEETVLEPERPIVDAHHHLWDHPGHRYLLREYLDDAVGHNLRQSVFVECLASYRQDGTGQLRPVGETEFVAGQAKASEEAGGPLVGAGIVGHANLMLGASVAEVLAAHKVAGAGRFRGVRHSCTWDASDEVVNSHSGAPRGLFGRDDFRAGFEQLAHHDLQFEAWCYHTQLGELVELARAFPATPVVLDHVGGPVGVGPYAGRRQEIFVQWQVGIRALAACSNVVVKLGGLAMPVNGFGWENRRRAPGSEEVAAAFAPYFHYCIEQFGVERCMFESNFPVDKVSCSYTVVWNAFKRIASTYSAAQQDALFHDNALRVYSLAAR